MIASVRALSWKLMFLNWFILILRFVVELRRLRLPRPKMHLLPEFAEFPGRILGNRCHG